MTLWGMPPKNSKACWWQAKKCSMVWEPVNSTVHHTAVAQDHDKEPPPASRLTHRDGAKRPPIDLGTLAWGKGEREKGGRVSGPDGAHIGLHHRIAAIKAVLAEALEHLGSRIGIALQHMDNLPFERIEFAGVRAGRAGAEVCLGQPVGHRARIEHQCRGNL